MIQFKNVTFAYDERPVLKNISFELAAKESLVIMGPSGSGKSTILRLLLGLDCPQSGSILVNGRDICRIKEKEKRKIRQRMGMVFQDGALFDSLTVGENVGYYLLELTRTPAAEVEKTVRQMLGFVNLDPDEVIDQLPDQLSGGMQRRVAIARALVSNNPQIMLYDEPTTGLDPKAIENVLSLINMLSDYQELATIMVTHQIIDAFSVADRFVVVDSGEIVFDGSPEELRVSEEPKVQSFLAPFQGKFEMVARKRYLHGEIQDRRHDEAGGPADE